MAKTIFGKKKNRNLLLNYFKPSIYVQNVNKINLESLKKHGIKVFICDLDNTLIPFYRGIPNADNLNLIQKVQDLGMTFVLVSNNARKRVERFALKAGIKHYYWNAKKPLLKYFRIISRQFNVNPHEMIMVGDQLITDVLFANRAHMESILVVPVTGVDESNRFIRLLESVVYKRLAQKNILHKGFFDEGEYGLDYDIL
ncbi:MAG: YqeG family HAD IIIA-type phosphatase [Spiroplasma poulsonii]|uniref:UMP phosphatase n=1 Tax=Spiroplasma poulsonii TaxID=2138 RepID=A0A2P6FD25_9MOLU|nr:MULTISPECIES: YqeG family HAD IIIA-type phosphatase [Spiroplasma]KAF0850952.1 UMP phosphatase [Spiroplasma poulsonii]MBH8623350.1 YqeG family HAD IIIA-type phosphatase [Spiroplasma sp. hyd1]MBW1242500.1 YqeG family HAD IIIA-type phosphatase [Spiroplasma poulsonii]PQM31322.1 UMP phosphatase [Spiroplasma poulsonii]PWF96325.1 UMP phosphatase [Spiroplasma poulsonii]